MFAANEGPRLSGPCYGYLESGMTAGIKQSWRRFEASKPGHRFQERYRRRQEREGGWRDLSKLFFLVGGLVIAVGSLLLGVLPGPGTLTFFVGLGMIAGEFRPIARLLDWAEVRARELGRWGTEVSGGRPQRGRPRSSRRPRSAQPRSSTRPTACFSVAESEPYSPNALEAGFRELRVRRFSEVVC